MISTRRASVMAAVVTAALTGVASAAGAAPSPALSTTPLSTTPLAGTSTAAPAPVTNVVTSSPVAAVPVVGPVVGSLLDTAPAPATTTAAPANTTAAPAARTAAASPTLTVTPSTGLTNGETVTVTASGMHVNAYGSVLECNLADNEPTVQVEGNAVPVGCTNPLQTITGTDASGGFTKAFVIHTGTIGPPAQGTDSAGNPASADAARYPCPPTPAQQAAGTTCDIVYGDTSGDQATAPLGFAATGSAGSAASGGASTAAASGAAGSMRGSGSAAGGAGGSLAFTGAGPGLRWLAGTGLTLTGAGLLLMAAALRLRRRTPSLPATTSPAA